MRLTIPKDTTYALIESTELVMKLQDEIASLKEQHKADEEQFWSLSNEVIELKAQLVESENLRKGVELGMDCANAEAIRLREHLAECKKALSAMLTHMGMDEDEWNKPTFDQARKALTRCKEVLK